MKSHTFDENHQKQSEVCRLLQDAVIRLCQKNYSRNDIEVDGIICISFQNSYQQHVVKIHEKLQTVDSVYDNTLNDVSPKGLVVCDLTQENNSSQSTNSFNISKDGLWTNVAKRKNGRGESIIAGSLVDFGGSLMPDTSIQTKNGTEFTLRNRRFPGIVKSKRKNRTPTNRKEMSRTSYGDGCHSDDGEQMQHLLNTCETQDAIINGKHADNESFIVIKSEPMDDKTEVSTSNSDDIDKDAKFQDEMEDGENAMSAIEGGNAAMYIIKNESSDDEQSCEYQQIFNSLDENCESTQQNSQMKYEDFYDVSKNQPFDMSESLSTQSNMESTEVLYNSVYETVNNDSLQSSGAPDEEGSSFSISRPCDNQPFTSDNDSQRFNDQMCYESSSSTKSSSTKTPMLFPHLKFKSFNPTKMLNTKQNASSVSKASRFSSPSSGAKRFGMSSNQGFNFEMLRLKTEDFVQRRIHFCRYCGKGFTMKCTQMRHEKTICAGGGEANYQCDICEKYFTRSDSRLRHMLKTHGIKLT